MNAYCSTTLLLCSKRSCCLGMWEICECSVWAKYNTIHLYIFLFYTVSLHFLTQEDAGLPSILTAHFYSSATNSTACPLSNHCVEVMWQCLQHCEKIYEPTHLAHLPWSFTLSTVQWLTWHIVNPYEGTLSPIICSSTSLYWVKRGQVISWDCSPYFLSSRAICVSLVGCIRPGKYNTSTKPVPFYPLFQSAPSNIILSLLVGF